jgi:hypothetical protein
LYSAYILIQGNGPTQRLVCCEGERRAMAAGSSNESAVLALRRTAAGAAAGRGCFWKIEFLSLLQQGVEFLPPLWRDLLQATRPPSSCCLDYALPLLPVFSFHFCCTSTRARARKSSNFSGVFLPNFCFLTRLTLPYPPFAWTFPTHLHFPRHRGTANMRHTFSGCALPSSPSLHLKGLPP